MCRTCSQCGLSGHNSRTCTDAAGGVATGAGGVTPIENGIMLFGVRVVAAASGGGGGGFRKSASMNNLSQFENRNQESNGDVVAAGYASDDVVHASDRNRDRKRGVPWTEEEHRMFLLGLEKVGKGDWRGISRNFVKSRTPTQVASHAQKYFIRRNNHNRRRRRSSLFDITTDSVMDTTMKEDHIFSLQQHNDSMEDLTLGQCSKMKSCSSSKFSRSIPLIPTPSSSKMAKLNLDEPSGDTESLHLSLKLSTTPTSMEENAAPSVRRSSAFESMSDNFNNNGDSIISVA